MLQCPHCHHEEMIGTLYCSQCGAALYETADTAAISTEQWKKELASATPAQPFPQPPPQERDAIAALVLLDQRREAAFFLQNNRSYTVGRGSEGQSVLPDVDLSPYQGYELGVSRMHAMIRLAEGRIYIKDLASSNGTRLNGKYLSPHAEHTLKHGDVLTLGKLKLQVVERNRE
ncbi:MAG: FHA domain-containing protein [Anaerolineae bacterium]|nr:MAG: FHA domain-containing protein [Anaerolineae bacterium]